MENFFDTRNLIRIFLKWKWHFIIVMTIAAIAGILFSSPMFIKPKFTSFAILYPANLSTFSEESQTEQMLQWLESSEIMDSIIVKYDFALRYKIDPSTKHIKTVLRGMYNKNVRISKTQFESVRIEVIDIEPVIARDMVNSIIKLYNNLVNASHREKYLEVLQIERTRLFEKKQQLDSLKENIVSLREAYGLLDYGIQTSEVTKGFLGTFDGGNMAQVNIDEVIRIKNNIQSKGDSLLLLTNLMSASTSAYTNWLVSYEIAKLNVEKELTFATIVTHPVVADKKSYPIRWLIVMSFLLAFSFFFLLIITLIENSKSIRESFADPSLKK
jgi:capsule polysaccharide export protein KpsE/RkpR